jgi:streptogramin lyase
VLAGVRGPEISAPIHARLTDAPLITEYPFSSTHYGPEGIAQGPDGNMWVALYGSGELAVVTPGGSISYITVPLPSWNSNPYATTSTPESLALGPDGRMWVTLGYPGGIAAVSSTGQVQEYQLPSNNSPYCSGSPWEIIAGPNGNMWFTMYEDLGDDSRSGSTGCIGEITMSGAVTMIELPSDNTTARSSPDPEGIVLGPDGDVWVADPGTSAIDRITPSGAITEYMISSTEGVPAELAVGPDGAIWFTEVGNYWVRSSTSGAEPSSYVGSISTNGQTGHQYSLGSYSALYLSPGPVDGAVWFTDPNNDAVGGVTPADDVGEYPLPTANAYPTYLTGASDGSIWVSESNVPGVATFSPPSDLGFAVQAPVQTFTVGCPVTLIPGTDQPALVVIMGSGVGTSISEEDQFYPVDTGDMPTNHPTVTSYCSPYAGVINGSYPQSVVDVTGGQYDVTGQYASSADHQSDDQTVAANPPPQGIASPDLPDQLAQAGAVLLPYSYRVAHLNCESGPPLMTVNPYSASVPETEAMNLQASALYTEVAEIHSCWADSAIDIIAESGAGVVAEYYWDQGYLNAHDGVDHVITLDSPINGVWHSGLLGQLVVGALGDCGQLLSSSSNCSFYETLWDNMNQTDAYELSHDGDDSFVPIGTSGDHTYDLADLPLNGLLSQMLFNYEGGVYYGVQPPDYLSSCDGAQYPVLNGLSFSSASHAVMKFCAPTVSAIVAAAAGDEQEAISGEDPSGGLGSGPTITVPESGPSVSSDLVAGAVGQSVTVSGQDLGSTPGTVSVSGPSGSFIAASVASWSSTAFSVVVPSDAVSGPVVVELPGDDELYFSLAVLQAPNGVSTLQLSAPVPAVGGQPEQLTVTAEGASGAAVPNATVSLFDGAQETDLVTGSNGQATFNVIGYGTETVLVYSGAAAVPVQLDWAPIPGPVFQPLSLLPDDGPPSPSPISATGVTLTSTQSISATVAQFTDPNPVPASFATSINWGDGSPSTVGTVTADPNGGWDVSGSHTYAQGGTYSVVVSITDDEGVSASVTSTLTVTQTGVVISVTGNQAYGGTPTFTPDYSADPAGTAAMVSGSLTCSTSATSASTVAGGPYTISNCSGLTSTLGPITYTYGALTVTPAPLTIVATPSSLTMTYGGAVPTVVPEYTGLEAGDTAPATPPTCTTSATSTSSVTGGPYPTSCLGAIDPDYTISYDNAATITVTPAPLLITATPASTTMPYGGPVPAVTPTYTGLLNGATAPATPPTCTTAATATSPVSGSPYATSCAGASDPNYTITYNNTATITVVPNPIVVGVTGTQVYGSAPIYTPSYVGVSWVGNDSPVVVTGTLSCSTSATASSPVAGSPYTISGCSGLRAANYSIAYSYGQLTVSPAPLTITATPSNPAMLYGGPVPTVTPIYTGLVNGNQAPAMPPTCTTAVTATSPVAGSPYATSCSGAIDPNYAITYNNAATISVAPRPITVTVAGSQVYGSTPVYTPSYSGVSWVGSDGPSMVTGKLKCSTSATASSPVAGSPYTISGCSGLSAANYAITYNDGALTVTPASTATTSVSSVNPAVTGQAVTYTATVTSTGGSVNPNGEGSVTFLSGTTKLCGGAVVLSGDRATCTVTYPAVGSYPVTASYSGGSDFIASSALALTETVARDATTTSLGVSSSSVVFGQQLTLTATVAAKAPGAGVPTGTVSFLDGTVSLGTATLNSAGKATLTTQGLVVGTHAALTAVYSGDPNYLTSTSAASKVVVAYTSCITGTHTGALTVTAGQVICITGTQTGAVTVQAGGALAIVGGHVTGPVQVSGATAFMACGATITGALSVQGATGPVIIGEVLYDGAACAANTITGAVTLSQNTGQVALGGSTVTGPVSVTGDVGGPTVIEGNKITGPLSCSGNTPPPTDGGYPNTVTGARSGQCSAAGF